ncbi:MAG: TIGR04086 family membrane protein [Lachnospiraceae bacterium]
MARKKAQSRKFLWGLLVGIVYFLILLVLSCINGSLSASQSMIVLCICAGSGTVGGMLA